jgi:TPR repeat protein
VPRDRAQAAALFRKACDGGYKDACDQLSRMN